MDYAPILELTLLHLSLPSLSIANVIISKQLTSLKLTHQLQDSGHVHLPHLVLLLVI